jgi:hypothetical protein
MYLLAFGRGDAGERPSLSDLGIQDIDIAWWTVR